MNSKSIIVTLYLLCLLAIPSLSSVSLSNLKQFFSATYDINQDGYASLQEFINYYHFL